MHQCLYCNKPCIETTIFCDECRTSLLERQHPRGLAQSERTTHPARDFHQPTPPFTENGGDASGEKPATPLSTLPYRSSCKPLAARARALLPVFIMLGAIALVAVGILLEANVLHRHTLSLTDMAAITGTGIVLSPQAGSTTWAGETRTPAISPVAGTPIPTSAIAIRGTGTQTGTSTSSTGTTTPGAGTPTPVSMPTSTPTTLTSCILQAAPSHLSFTATLLQPDPPGQLITLKTTNTCGKPVMWKATADASWIQFSSTTGSDNGSGSTVTVYARSNTIVGVYTAHITVTVVDSNGRTVQGGAQTMSVTLTVIG